MIGSNVPTVGGLPKGFHWAKKWRCECIQIYVTLSRRWDVPELSQKEVSQFLSAWGDSPVSKVVAHVPFLVNLASPDEDLQRKARGRLETELCRAERFGVSFLVLHPGSYTDSNREDGTKRIIEGLDAVLSKVDTPTTKILVETMSGQGTEIGASFEELARILETVKRPELLGVCFDTAHVFAAGYDIRGYKGYEEVLREFDRIVGLEQIQTVHLNDSKTPLGSRSDRHACIGEGKLGLQVFHALLRDPRFRDVPKIIEIPERDRRSQDNLELLRELRTTQGAFTARKDIYRQLILKGVS